MDDEITSVPNYTEAELFPFKGFWIRVLAAFIDYIFLSFVPFIIMIILLIFFGGILGDIGYLIGTLLSIVLWIAISLGYKPVMESSSFQGTFGKYFLGIKIVNRDGHRITLKAAIIRYLLFVIGSGSHVLGLGSIIIGFDERKQGVHDMVADTYVVSKYHYGPIKSDGKTFFEKLNKKYVSIGSAISLIFGLIFAFYGISMTLESFEYSGDDIEKIAYLINMGITLLSLSIGFLLTSLVLFIMIFFIKNGTK